MYIIPVKRVKNLCTSYYTFTPINVNICLIVFVIYIQAFIYIYYSTFAFLKYNIIYTRISLVKFLKMCPVVILLQQNSS